MSTDAKTPPFAYECFGQHIHSDFQFQEMDETQAADPDLLIIRNKALLRPPEKTQMAQFLPDRQFFDFPDVAQAEITDKTRLAIALYPGAAEAMLGLPVFGPVMATMLHYRGYLVLHGSGLVIDGKLNVFVGHRGAGKSTTAACLVKRGHQLFTDDLVVIDLSDPSNPLALPGYSAMKIAPDIAGRFQPEEAELLSNGGYPYPKERLRIRQKQPLQCMPIKAIYELERADGAGLEALDFNPAMNTLMQHSYMLKFGNAPMAAGRGAAHFTQVTRLASLVGVHRLKTPSSLAALHQIEPLLTGAA
ncbi:MAG: hypothetical protein CMI63_17375 [Parvularcula sp.]|nr:hypothetical protein [Parvularcula sp.]